jgi:excisionase family DNA binding protein
MENKLLLKVGEAASALGVAKITIYRLIWAGAIKPVHIGRAVRIPLNELERFTRELQETGKVYDYEAERVRRLVEEDSDAED